MIVVRGDGVLLVDSRAGPAEALELLAQVRAITDAPVRWLVNTHWHEDHIGGNQVFRDSFPELVIVGTGAKAEFPPRELTFAFARRGVGLQVMDTAAAARTFNVLAGEGRRVAAVLYTG